MNHSFLRFIHCILFILISSQLMATHIVGGEMNYRCLGNDQYEISLTIFRDCDTGVPWFDDPAVVGVFEGGSNNYLFSQLVSLNPLSNDTLDIYPEDSCLTVTTGACIHTTTYVDTITLAMNTSGYTIAYQRCCRNQDIVNIVLPDDAGATYWTYISPTALQGCNSSAVFQNWPRVYLCAGVPLNIDHSAIDADGDSIVYELCTPSDGGSPTNPVPNPPSSPPFNTINWQPPYGLGTMLGTTNPLTIDPFTGVITGTPQTTGVFLVGVCLREYRNGQLISITRRDFQHIVGPCTPNTIAAFDTTNLDCNKTLTFPFANTSQVVTGSYEWTFGNAGTSTTVHPTFTFPDTGIYTVTLVAGIGSPCLDTFSVDMDVNIEAIDLSLPPAQVVCAGDTVLLVASDAFAGYSDSANYMWTPSAAVVSGQGTDSVYVVVNQDAQIQVQGVNNYGCASTAVTSLSLREITANFTPVITPCNTSLSMQFQNGSTSNPTTSSYQWQFGNLGFATATNPVFNFPDTGTYPVTLIAGYNGPCPDTVTVDVDLDITGVDLQNLPDQTVCKGDSVWLNAVNLYDSYYNATYNWTPNSVITSGQGTNNVLIVANNSTQVQLTVSNVHNCADSISLDIGVEEVTAAFDTLDLACNISLNIPFVNASTSNLSPTNYLWTFDNLGTSTTESPIFTFPDTGTYTIDLIAGVGSLCPDTVTMDLYLPLYGVDLTPIPPNTVCVGDSVWLTISDVLEQYSSSIDYTWTPASAILAGQGTDSVLIIANSSTTIQVAAINSHLCRDTALATIDVLEVAASFDTLNLECNTSLLLPFINTSTSNSTPNNYYWAFDNLGTSTDENPTYAFPDTGSYNVALVAEVGSLCRDTFNMDVYLPLHGLIMDLDDVQVLCKGDTVDLVVTNALDAYTDWVNYQWTPTNMIVSGQGNDTAQAAILDTNTVFTVIGNNSHGCVDTAEAIGSIVYIWPTVNITATPDSIFLGQTSQLEANYDANYIYNWTPDTTLSDYFIRDPEAAPRQTTTYYLTVTNQFGCRTIDSVIVKIREPICDLPVVFVPNAFSPDGDGHNDVLMVNGNNITEMTMAIYNRWGEKVFETNDQSIGWDGTYKGKPLPPDVYGYYMKCLCEKGGELFVKGNITLLR